MSDQDVRAPRVERDGARDGGDVPAFPGLSRVAPLGSGGMGTVFSAWQDDLDRPVAVKTVRRDLRDDARLRGLFTREAHVLARLDHAGIVPVHYSGETADGPYYVMRLVEGVSVERHLEHASSVDVATVFRSIAQALATAHRAGVLHRDVKPENVLVEPTGRPVLVDFGLSMRVPVGERDAEAELVGTPDYLAPELLDGANYSIATDVYALGATLYTTLCGRVPFEAADLRAKLRAIRETDPPLPRVLRSGVATPLQAICLKAMERAPADRYPSADDMARDLERFLHGDAVLALPVRSASLLRRKIELHVADLADWERQGLLDPQQQGALRHAYEHLEAQQRSLLRGALSSIPNLLLLIGILLSVFGPLILQVVTWREQGALIRVALPGVPFALLATLGLRSWRFADRRRGVACLFGAALLAAPFAFALLDLVPALATPTEDVATLDVVSPAAGPLSPEAAARQQAHERVLEWKLALTASAALAMASACFRWTRAAAFLWIACLAAIGALVCAAQLAGWSELPPWSRWLLAGLGALALLGVGVRLEREFARDRAQPFYGLGFCALVVIALTYADQRVPMSFLGLPSGDEEIAWSYLLHGLAFVAAGVALRSHGTHLLQQTSATPLLVGFTITLMALGALANDGAVGYEILLVGACLGFLLLGLATHRNTLVLAAAIALPIAVGSVSQRHVDAVWAWSTAVVIGGATLVLASFHLSARKAPRAH